MTAPRALSTDERRAWLRLARTENVGPATFANLLARFGNVRAAIDAVPRLAQRGGKALQLPSEAEIARELDMLASAGARMIAYTEPGNRVAWRE